VEGIHTMLSKCTCLALSCQKLQLHGKGKFFSAYIFYKWYAQQMIVFDKFLLIYLFSGIEKQVVIINVNQKDTHLAN
jgi:hypothetical protein